MNPCFLVLGDQNPRIGDDLRASQGLEVANQLIAVARHRAERQLAQQQVLVAGLVFAGHSRKIDDGNVNLGHCGDL